MNVKEKILKELGSLSESDEKQLDQLLELENGGTKFSKSKINMFISQFKFGMDDIYERYFIIEKSINPKDTSSLFSYVLKYGEENGKKMFEERLQKTTINLNYYIDKYGEKKGLLEYEKLQKSKSMSLENCVKRHGEIKGRNIYDEFWKNTSFSLKEEKLKKKYGDRWQIEKNKISDKISKSRKLEGYIEKYGDVIGKEKYTERNKKQGYKVSYEGIRDTLLEKNPDLTMAEIDEIIRLNKSRNLDFFVKKYGEDGKSKHSNMIAKMKKSNPMSKDFHGYEGKDEDEIAELITNEAIRRMPQSYTASKASLQALSVYINKLEILLGEKCLYGSEEFFLRLYKNEREVSKNRIYYYDFAFVKNKIIIEFHGKLYHNNFLDYNTTKNMSFSDFEMYFDKDAFKKWVAENRGFDCIVIREWEKKKDLRVLGEYIERIENEGR